MGPQARAGGDTAADHHAARVVEQQERVDQFHSQGNRLALLNLLIAVSILALLVTAFAEGTAMWIGFATVAILAFGVVRFLQSRAMAAHDWAEVRRQIHERHVARISGEWRTFETSLAAPPHHPFALDLDLVGPTSLLQRIDTTHTKQGENTLLRWLSEPATPAELKRRQDAVGELSENEQFREDLEAAGCIAQHKGKLDEGPFRQFTEQRGLFDERPSLVWIATGLPLITAVLLALGWLGLVPGWAPAISVLLQAAVTVFTGGVVTQRFELVAARRGFAEALVQLLRATEQAPVQSELLQELRAKLSPGGALPSKQFAGLDRWSGLSDLRHQVLAHLPINWLLLWDLQVLFQLERWTKRHKKNADALFEAIGAFEALSALATLLAVDDHASVPEITSGSEGPGLSADGLAHPLLPAEARVTNDVCLMGAGSCLVVTGSNMAGKSTLLRAVGLNLALALAGGPVCARRFSCSPVRIRASMRAEDDLGQGASYFHAELSKLRGVIEGAEAQPPIFFLLDELLRGTNARARHVGAKAVIEHLLDRGALGLVATHDVQLGLLEEERPSLVRNAHFTDVVIDGEMTFDYRLQEGVVKTSNALRLLQLAGIEVNAELMENAELQAPILPDSSS